MLFAILLPESPRWLFAKNKEKQGIAIAQRMARINRVTISEKTWADARREGEQVSQLLASISKIF